MKQGEPRGLVLRQAAWGPWSTGTWWEADKKKGARKENRCALSCCTVQIYHIRPNYTLI